MNRWDDVIEVSLPLPFPLKIIKAYLIKGSKGYTVVDTGLHVQDDLDEWDRVSVETGFSWDEVEKIVLTHYHPDHFGLGGTLQRRTGSPVYISRTDFEQARLFFRSDSDQPDVMARFYSEHGLPAEWVEKIPGHLRGFTKWVEPFPDPTWIAAGETIRLGNREYRILHTPGHADGHLSFYDPERQWLIGGDFLLPRITPNISLWPGCDPDPLSSYLNTLERMKDLPVKKVFPSHGPVFQTYRERIEQLQHHHQERLDRMRDWVEEENGTTAVDVCFRIFGENLSVHNLRFALSETLAHLEYMYRRGEIAKEKRAGNWIYLGR
ncbi:MBL fold metallo-hydrolase [Paludifilum halophilum]|uniref:Metallo-beta-lactamase domain-containing protein n=1 Tax=Paludifilum halophilum TaxID=1642702 RepID=A0A235B4J4_9BACL|nr:MBL fold metallo-hydrolase [Paludifilum halophilum]OYD07228.1 hypothetical protein CHM34_12655 [Paludifilum halophilum]